MSEIITKIASKCIIIFFIVLSFAIEAQTICLKKTYESDLVLNVVKRDSLIKMGQYNKSIALWHNRLQDSIYARPMYNLAVNYTLLGNYDSAFYYLNRYVDLSKDDRMMLVDRDLFALRKDSTRWNDLVNRIENGYLQLLDSVINKSLALRLFYLGIADQEYRVYLPFLGQSTDSTWRQAMQNDKRLIDSLECIIAGYGFPALSMVGNLAHLNAFLLLQHSDKINKYYKAIKTIYLNHDFDPQCYALLTDRRLMYKHRKQIYGTQWISNKRTTKKYEDKYMLYPVRDFKNLENRRKQIGLTYSMEESAELVNGVIPEKYYRKCKK